MKMKGSSPYENTRRCFLLIKNSVSAQPYSVCRTQGYYVSLNLPSSLCSATSFLLVRYDTTSYFNVRLLTTKLRSPVHPIGVEPITLALEGRCSIQLSYGCSLYVGEGLPTECSRLFGISYNVIAVVCKTLHLWWYDHKRPHSPLSVYLFPNTKYHRWESNPHEHYCSRDFKSLVSTNSTTVVISIRYTIIKSKNLFSY